MVCVMMYVYSRGSVGLLDVTGERFEYLSINVSRLQVTLHAMNYFVMPITDDSGFYQLLD